MDGARDNHVKWCKSEKDKYMMSHMWESKKKWYKWNYFHNRNTLTDIENKLTVPKGMEGAG